MKWLLWLEVLMTFSAKCDTEWLIGQKEKFLCEIVECLVVGAGDFGLEFDDVAILHLGYVKECDCAIENDWVSWLYTEGWKCVFLGKGDCFIGWEKLGLVLLLLRGSQGQLGLLNKL